MQCFNNVLLNIIFQYNVLLPKFANTSKQTDIVRPIFFGVFPTLKDLFGQKLHNRNRIRSFIKQPCEEFKECVLTTV